MNKISNIKRMKTIKCSFSRAMDVEWTGPAHCSIARGSTNKEMK